MKIDKVAGQYNTYKVEMSWGQLMTLKSALERDHADPISDEAYAEICWYIDHLPQPGEEKEDLKARDESGAEITKDGKDSEEGGEGDGDYPLPMPPGHDKMGGAPGLSPGGEGDEPPGGGGDEPSGPPGGDAGPEGGSTPVPGEDLEDGGEGLPKPPAE